MQDNNSTKVKWEDIIIKTVLSCSYNVCDWYLKMHCDKLKVNFRKFIVTITNKTKRNSLKGNKID